MQSDAVAAPAADKKGGIVTGRYVVQLPLIMRFRFWLRVRIIQSVLALILWLRKEKPYERPTLLKKIVVQRPNPLPLARVFIPSSYKAGSKTLFPTHIDIHGGGYSIASPKVDDMDNATLCREHGFLVISIGYSLAPQFPWPTAVHDIAAQIEAILDDDSLPIDKKRVSVGGYSAGGNLSLTSVQLRGLHKRVAAIVGVYPSTDFIRTLEEKLAASKVAPHRKADVLEDLGPVFQWSYLPTGQDKHDPLISPIMAKRETLPKHLLFIGCEYDMLHSEAEQMAEKVAKADGGKAEKREFKTDYSTGWKQGNIQYIFLQGVEHGYNSLAFGISKQQKAFNRERAIAMHRQIASWLKDDVYQS